VEVGTVVWLVSAVVGSVEVLRRRVGPFASR
jgi:hypothetical protein